MFTSISAGQQSLTLLSLLSGSGSPPGYPSPSRVWRWWKVSHVTRSPLPRLNRSSATQGWPEQTQRVTLSSASQGCYTGLKKEVYFVLLTSRLSGTFRLVHREQFVEQGPAHPHHVQVQAELQPGQEPHGPHTRLRKPGNTLLTLGIETVTGYWECKSKHHFLIFPGHFELTFAVCPLESNGDHNFVSYSLFDLSTQSYFSLKL